MKPSVTAVVVESEHDLKRIEERLDPGLPSEKIDITA